MTTFAASPGPGGFLHEFVTTPGMLAVINGVIGGVLAAMIVVRAGAGPAIGVTVGVAVAIGLVVVLAVHQFRRAVAPRGRRPRFPSDVRQG